MGTFRYPVSPLRPRVQPSNHEIALRYKQQLRVKIEQDHQRIQRACAQVVLQKRRPIPGEAIKAVARDHQHIRRNWRTNGHILHTDCYSLYPLSIPTSIGTKRELWLDFAAPGRDVYLLQPARCAVCRYPSDPLLLCHDLREYMLRTIHTELELSTFTQSFLAHITAITSAS